MSTPDLYIHFTSHSNSFLCPEINKWSVVLGLFRSKFLWPPEQPGVLSVEDVQLLVITVVVLDDAEPVVQVAQYDRNPET